MKLSNIYKQILIENDLDANFKKWFGKSKVVDSSGNPMICYHGTPNGTFSEFKPKTGSKGKPSPLLSTTGMRFSSLLLTVRCPQSGLL